MKIFLLLLTANLAGAGEYSRPAVIKPESLREFASLAESRRKLVVTALSVAKDHAWLRYRFGSADPKKKGFDCSGAMSFVLKSLNYKIPRTSSNQYLWTKKHKTYTNVGSKVTSLADPVFKKLKPGDLVFWSGTYNPTDDRKTKITHVGLYLGTEKKDGRPVMICASKGRSYRGKAGDGYGVYDFKIPRPASRSKLVGFGTPPGTK
jgi:cell wall-associated NlpC family hydrolase